MRKIKNFCFDIILKEGIVFERTIGADIGFKS